VAYVHVDIELRCQPRPRADGNVLVAPKRRRTRTPAPAPVPVPAPGLSPAPDPAARPPLATPAIVVAVDRPMQYPCVPRPVRPWLATADRNQCKEEEETETGAGTRTGVEETPGRSARS
jgi:hypothetical protein